MPVLAPMALVAFTLVPSRGVGGAWAAPPPAMDATGQDASTDRGGGARAHAATKGAATGRAANGPAESAPAQPNTQRAKWPHYLNLAYVHGVSARSQSIVIGTSGEGADHRLSLLASLVLQATPWLSSRIGFGFDEHSLHLVEQGKMGCTPDGACYVFDDGDGLWYGRKTFWFNSWISPCWAIKDFRAWAGFGGNVTMTTSAYRSLAYGGVTYGESMDFGFGLSVGAGADYKLSLGQSVVLVVSLWLESGTPVYDERFSNLFEDGHTVERDRSGDALHPRRILLALGLAFPRAK